MTRHKPFRNVWLIWGRGWAVQFWPEPYFSLGFHIDPRRPILDLHIGCLIVSVGKTPQFTEMRDIHRHTCRGFLRTDDPAGLL